MLLLALVMTLKHPHLFSLQIVVRGRVNIDVYLGPLITSAHYMYIHFQFIFGYKLHQFSLEFEKTKFGALF